MKKTTRSKILHIMGEYRGFGLTAYECASLLGLAAHCVASHFTDMRRAGMLVETGKTRPNSITGNANRVLTLSE